MKCELKTSEHGDQYFIMLNSEIVKVFITHSRARLELKHLNKFSNVKLIKKEEANNEGKKQNQEEAAEAETISQEESELVN